MDAFEVPYGGKPGVALRGLIFMCFTTVLMGFAATKDLGAAPWMRIFVGAMSVFSLVLACVSGATFVVTVFVNRTLRLTMTELCAPRFGFSLQSTHVLLSTVTKVSLRSFQDGSRYLNIYYNGSRLGVSEIFMPSRKDFNRVLMAFSGTPGANNSFKADAFGAA